MNNFQHIPVSCGAFHKLHITFLAFVGRLSCLVLLWGSFFVPASKRHALCGICIAFVFHAFALAEFPLVAAVHNYRRASPISTRTTNWASPGNGLFAINDSAQNSDDVQNTTHTSASGTALDFRRSSLAMFSRALQLCSDPAAAAASASVTVEDTASQDIIIDAVERHSVCTGSSASRGAGSELTFKAQVIEYCRNQIMAGEICGARNEAERICLHFVEGYLQRRDDPMVSLRSIPRSQLGNKGEQLLFSPTSESSIALGDIVRLTHSGHHQTGTRKLTITAITTYESLQTALTSWCTNPTTAASTYGDILTWDTAAVLSMYDLLLSCSSKSSFNSDISTWDTSSVTNMGQALTSAPVFNQAVGLWDVGKVTFMLNMFYGDTAFDKELSYWDVRKVTNLSGMFSYALSFNQALGAWDTSSCQYAESMFYSASAFNQGLEAWDVSRVPILTSMFNQANKFNQVLCWDLSGKTTSNMFDASSGSVDSAAAKCSCGPGTYFSGSTCVSCPGGQYSPRGKSTSCLACVDGKISASGASTCVLVLVHTTASLKAAIAAWCSNPTTAAVNYGDISIWDTSEVGSMSELFYTHCEIVSTFNSAGICAWDTSSVTAMFQTFASATAFNQDIGSSWDVSKVSTMSYMFQAASVFNQDVNLWDVSKVTDMSAIFYGALAFNKDVGPWDVSNVADMRFMFRESNLNQDIGFWDVSKVTIMYAMFYSNTAINQAIDTWSIGNVRSVSFMFSGAAGFNQEIGSWDVSQVTDASYMFNQAVKFNQVLCWDLTNMAKINIFAGSSGAADSSAAKCSCGAGMFYTGSTCAPCPGGQYSPRGKSTSCYVCPSGSNSPGSSTACFWPTSAPTLSPTVSKQPTFEPTGVPTEWPGSIPTSIPTELPSNAPVPAPTPTPSKLPYSAPTKVPVPVPTPAPSEVPSPAPTSNCRSGQYYDGFDCVNCQIGRTTIFSTPPWPRECSVCQVGTYSNHAGTSPCAICPTGKFSGSERIFCEDCSSGEFVSNQTSCEKCPMGHYAPRPLQDACIPCASGSITALTGASTCTSCDLLGPGYTSVEASHECTLCVAGYVDVGLRGAPADCTPCGSGDFKHVKCELKGTTLASIRLSRGYWRTNDDSSDIRTCPSDFACVGGSDIQKYCRDGHIGPFCSLCDKHFYADVTSRCTMCDSWSGGATEALFGLAGIIAIVLTGGVIWFGLYRHMTKSTKKRAKNVAKIAFVFIQVLSSVPANFATIFPSPFDSFVGGLGYFALNVPVASTFGCMFPSTNFYTELFVATMAPFGLIFVFMACKVLRHRGNRIIDVLRDECAGPALLVLYVFLPVASRVVFGYFACDELDDGRTLLVVDYSVSCDATFYRTAIAYAVVMIMVWPIGVTALFASLLIHNRRNIQGQDLSKARLAVGRLHPPEEDILEARDLDRSLDNLRLLFDTYTPVAWYWEIWVTSRRLILTGAIVIFARGSVVQCSVGMFICIAAALLQSAYRPYVDYFENLIALLVEINLILVLYLSLLYTMDTSRLEGSTGGGIGILLVVLTVLVLAGGVIITGISYMYQPVRVGGLDAGLEHSLTTSSKRTRSHMQSFRNHEEAKASANSKAHVLEDMHVIEMIQLSTNVVDGSNPLLEVKLPSAPLSGADEQHERRRSEHLRQTARQFRSPSTAALVLEKHSLDVNGPSSAFPTNADANCDM